MIPLIILAIESPEDREYMTHLYLEYERLMYWEINKYIDTPWDADDIMQCLHAAPLWRYFAQNVKDDL